MTGHTRNHARILRTSRTSSRGGRVNARNRPYGAFEWLDLPEGRRNGYNSHNFYGDLRHRGRDARRRRGRLLQTPTTRRTPVLVAPATRRRRGEDARPRSTSAGSRRARCRRRPASSEPKQTAEEVQTEGDKLARTPAIAFGYHLPPRMTPTSSRWRCSIRCSSATRARSSTRRSSRTSRSRPRRRAASTTLGNDFDYNGPMLYTFRVDYRPDLKGDDVLKAVDGVISGIQQNGITEDELTGREGELPLLLLRHPGGRHPSGSLLGPAGRLRALQSTRPGRPDPHDRRARR